MDEAQPYQLYQLGLSLAAVCVGYQC